MSAIWWVVGGLVLAALAKGGGSTVTSSTGCTTPLRVPYRLYAGGMFGAQRSGGVHHGLDLWQSDHGYGAPVYAARSGIVTLVVGASAFVRRGGVLAVPTTTLTRRGQSYPATKRASSGELLYCSNAPGSSYSRGHMGLAVWIESGEYVHRYLHLSGVAPGLSVGDEVRQGQLIGWLGGTDVLTDKPHLHFDVKRGGVWMDPAPLIGAAR